MNRLKCKPTIDSEIRGNSKNVLSFILFLPLCLDALDFMPGNFFSPLSFFRFVAVLPNADPVSNIINIPSSFRWEALTHMQVMTVQVKTGVLGIP